MRENTMKNATFYKFDIEPRNNLRVDQLLASYLPEYSRSRIKNWINNDKILINGKSCSPKDKLTVKSLVEIEIRPTEELDIISEDIPLEPLYEDDSFLVINKPSGMVTHTAVSNYSGTLQNALLFRYPELRSIPRAGIIHRLDKQTSGLLIIARTLNSHNYLTKQIQDRLVIKKYFALVSGVIKNIDIIDEKIGRHKVNRTKMSVSESGKESITKINILRRYEKASSLEVELVTGRTHQIRVHLAHIGHPIIGDKLYGFKKSVFTKYTEILNLVNSSDNIALHAASLEFKHPISKDIFRINSEKPKSFTDLENLIEERSYANTN
ncbi:MAG: RNA pseudouridine synthase [Gammaproteobacteria bacterium]|jgi:23S rRNA pseudouridine1911/1915/1917 synthase|nr:RNA pseudouridine synthase [Gammaproteobacteria bacterium]|tara:strand:- start:811 stop:1782 length:972 start_codon:yes stop_codon:yes gene_type:complete